MMTWGQAGFVIGMLLLIGAGIFWAIGFLRDYCIAVGITMLLVAATAALVVFAARLPI